MPPTTNLHHPDPACVLEDGGLAGLDFVPNAARKTPVRAALVNAFAFGGQNACVALRKWRAGGRP